MPSSSVWSNPGLTAILSTFVSVHSHEVSALLHSSSCFFFILSAYFVVLPLRDEGAISLGLSNLPGLFIGSLALTLVAAPLSTLAFSLPNYSKARVLLLMHRFFSISLVVFFFLWHSSSGGVSPFKAKGTVSVSSELKNGLQVNSSQIDCPADSGSKVGCPSVPSSWSDHGWFYIFVRIAFFLWIALMNLITISSTWARVIDVMDSESGSRLFGFIGAGATLGQLFGSLFATGMAWLGPYLLLFAALLMEFAAQSSKGIKKDSSEHPEELLQTSKANCDEQDEQVSLKKLSPKSPTQTQTPKPQPQLSTVLDGFRLIVSSTYLSYVSIFLWLSAVVSSFFYFQKVNVIATAVTSSVGRRRMFAQINSFIAVFILVGQLTLTGRILMTAGVTVAICSAPAIAFGNLVVIAVWPTWIAVAICETMRKVVTYVVARPGRELLFTVVSEEEKYKAKLCIDVVVQRLGDATAAGMYKLLFSTLHGRASTVSLYALPVCVVWIVIAFHLGRRQAQLAKLQDV